MEQKTITLSNRNIITAVEYFEKQLKKDGKNAAYSYMIYKNTEILRPYYDKILNQYYSDKYENAAKLENDLKQEQEKLALQYADRDEQGNVSYIAQGQFKITEQIAEYNEAMKAFHQQHANDYQTLSTVRSESEQFLNITAEYSVYVLNIESFPNEIIPIIVGLFGI